MGSRNEIPMSDVACESLDVRGDANVGDVLTVGGSLVVAGTPITGAGGTSGLFGTGADGNLNFDGVTPVVSALGGTLAFNLVPAASQYNLTRDVYAANMTVALGVRINCDGWRIFVSGTLTLNGAISCNGGNGGNGNAGAGGVAGTPRPTQLLFGGRLGTAGTNPTATGAAGMVPGNTHMGAGTALVISGANGGVMQGGGGGANELGLLGGTVAASPTGGAVNAPTFQVLSQALTGRMVNLTQLETSSSGAVGRPGSLVGTGGSGGSGAGGGTVILCANTIVGAGSVEATGGNAGLAGGAASGGSGGGGGGAVLVATKSQAPLTITVNVAGGLGSAAGGALGTTPGGNGGPGLAYVFAGV